MGLLLLGCPSRTAPSAAPDPQLSPQTSRPPAANASPRWGLLRLNKLSPDLRAASHCGVAFRQSHWTRSPHPHVPTPSFGIGNQAGRPHSRAQRRPGSNPGPPTPTVCKARGQMQASLASRGGSREGQLLPATSARPQGQALWQPVTTQEATRRQSSTPRPRSRPRAAGK